MFVCFWRKVRPFLAVLVECLEMFTASKGYARSGATRTLGLLLLSRHGYVWYEMFTASKGFKLHHPVITNNKTKNNSSSYFSLPSPQTAILLLSGDQEMSLILPEIGWYSYFRMCSFWVVSQILILPLASAHKQQVDQQ